MSSSTWWPTPLRCTGGAESDRPYLGSAKPFPTEPVVIDSSVEIVDFASDEIVVEPAGTRPLELASAQPCGAPPAFIMGGGLMLAPLLAASRRTVSGWPPNAVGVAWRHIRVGRAYMLRRAPVLALAARRKAAAK
jgi:hypothetical protein